MINWFRKLIFKRKYCSQCKRVNIKCNKWMKVCNYGGMGNGKRG